MWKCDKTQIVMNLRRNWLSGVGGEGGRGDGGTILFFRVGLLLSLQAPRREEERTGFATAL